MTKLKKIFACILATVMLLNLCSPMAHVVASDVVDSGALTVHNNTQEKRIWFTANGATSNPTGFCPVKPVTGEGTVSVKGSTDHNAYLCYSGTSKVYLLVMDDYSFVTNDQVTIKGKFQTSDGSFVIDIAETTFICVDPAGAEGAYWKVATAADFAEYQEVTINRLVNPSGWSDTDQRYNFYFDLNEEVGDNTSSIDGMKYAINDGEKKSLTALMTPHAGETLLAVVWITEVTEPTKITFSGKGVLSGNNKKGIALKNEVSVYINEYGCSLDGFIIQTAYTDTSVNGIDSAATKYVNAEQGWHFYLKLSEKSADIAYNSGLSGFEYSLNDGEKKPLTVSYAGHLKGSLFFIMPELPEAITENTKLTIFSGQAITADEYYGLNLTSDVTLYGNRYGWSLENYLLPTETGVPGDVNGDSKTTVSDLIYLKKYLKGTVTVNTQAELTKNDYVVDESDIDSLRQILITTYNSDNRPLGIPTYKDTREIEMAAYMGPRKAGMNYYQDGALLGQHTVDFINDFEFQRYKAAGFTYLIAEQDAAYGSENLATYMQLAKNNDLGVALLDHEMVTLLKADAVPSDVNLSTIKTRTKEMIDAYGDTFKGWMLADEPNIGHLTNYQMIAGAIRKADPTSFLMTAFLPLHAKTPDLTTNTEILNKIASGESLTVEEKNVAYMEYVDSYGELFREFNYDLYPLQSGKTVRSEWLKNLSLVAQGGKDKRYLTGITLQSHGSAKKDNGKTVTVYRNPDAEDDIGFQAYTALAYGMRKLNYYTYWGHYTQNESGYMTQTMVQYPEDGGTQSVTTPIYDAVKSVNTEIKKYDHVLMNYAWEGTITLGNADDSSESDYTNDRIVNCTATEDTSVVIGCMKDAVGYDGYMIANASNPADDVTTTVTVQFEQATKVVVYIDGNQTIVDLVNGTYTVKVPSGEGVFVIPIV